MSVTSNEKDFHDVTMPTGVYTVYGGWREGDMMSVLSKSLDAFTIKEVWYFLPPGSQSGRLTVTYKKLSTRYAYDCVTGDDVLRMFVCRGIDEFIQKEIRAKKPFIGCV